MGFPFFSFSGKQSYHRQITLFMLLFACVLFVPYTIVSYSIAKKNIINNIEFSNNVVLAQLNYYYRSNRNLIANICLEVYFNTSVQQFIYNQDIDYSDIYNCMKNLSNTTGMGNLSIDSIVLYNSRRAEWFSNLNTEPSLGQDLEIFLAGQNSIPKLTPLLRQVTRRQANNTYKFWVFSYFMYEFSDRDSYIVVNQNAGWFIDNLAFLQQTANQNNYVYLVNGSGIVYRSQSAISDETEEQLANYFLLKKESKDSGFIYEQKINNRKYLISFIQMGETDNYLLIVRNYDDVFGDIVNLQRDYLVIAAAFLLVVGLALIPFSRTIYLPMRNFLSRISANEPDMELPLNMGNEFVYLQNLYRNARELNERLHEQSAAYKPLVEEHKLFELVNDSRESAYIRFKEELPNHWLSAKAGFLRVCIIKPDRFKEANHYEKTDIPLLFQAIKNIIYRLLDEDSETAFFQEDSESLGLILRMEHSDENEFLEFIENCLISIKHHLDITVSVSYSRHSDNALTLTELYREAKELLQYRFVFGPGTVTGKKQCLANLENNEIQYPPELDEKLISAISEKKTTLVSVILDDIKTILCGFQLANINICTIALANKVVGVINKMNRENQSESKANSVSFYKKLIDMEFLDDFFDGLKTYILVSLGNVELEMKARHEKNIEDIINFVHAHYSNPNLCSQMIGDSLGFSNQYLMYKFLKSTGTTLTEYIVNVRMRKAANYLRNTRLSIREISEQIGIQNSNYFYRLFKQVYHCTPREFVERYNV